MKLTKWDYDIKLVHKVNYITILAITILMVIATTRISNKFEDFLPFVAVIIIVSILYFSKIKDNSKGFLFSAIITLSNFGYFITVDFSPNSLSSDTLVFIAAIIVAALYFNSKLVLLNGLILNVCLIILTIFNPNSILGQGYQLSNIINLFVMYNAILLLTFYLTTWGNSLVSSANAKSEESTILVEELNSLLKNIDINSESLDNNIYTFSDDLKVINETSTNINKSISQINIGVQESAKSIFNITTMVNESTESINETSSISNKISSISKEMKSQVYEGSAEINSMNNTIETIKTAVGVSLDTVNNLKNNIGNITSALEKISNISTEINLLSLNASIEAARAAEHGKGFAIVAEQVKKLAGESSLIVNDINSIIVNVTSITDAAVLKVSEGNEAANNGTEIIESVKSKFNNIENSFNDITKNLENEKQLINTIVSNFNPIKVDLESLASITEEHAASTEEIESIIGEQTNNIASITASMDRIKDMSSSLKNLSNK